MRGEGRASIGCLPGWCLYRDPTQEMEEDHQVRVIRAIGLIWRRYQAVAKIAGAMCYRVLEGEEGDGWKVVVI